MHVVLKYKQIIHYSVYMYVHVCVCYVCMYMCVCNVYVTLLYCRLSKYGRGAKAFVIAGSQVRQ